MQQEQSSFQRSPPFSGTRTFCRKVMKKNGRCCKRYPLFMPIDHQGMEFQWGIVLLRFHNGLSKGILRLMLSISGFIGQYRHCRYSFAQEIQRLLPVLVSRNISTGFGSSTCLTSKSTIILQVHVTNHLRSYSVITGTPPSIREDATIRIAPEILKGIDVSTRVLQILAEAELCLLWGKVPTPTQLF